MIWGPFEIEEQLITFGVAFFTESVTSIDVQEMLKQLLLWPFVSVQLDGHRQSLHGFDRYVTEKRIISFLLSQ